MLNFAPKFQAISYDGSGLVATNELFYYQHYLLTINEKEFIDEIRERNGNLNIMLMRLTEEAERL